MALTIGCSEKYFYPATSSNSVISTQPASNSGQYYFWLIWQATHYCLILNNVVMLLGKESPRNRLGNNFCVNNGENTFTSGEMKKKQQICQLWRNSAWEYGNICWRWNKLIIGELSSDLWWICGELGPDLLCVGMITIQDRPTLCKPGQI